MQTRELEEYCQRRGWQLADEYVDSRELERSLIVERVKAGLRNARAKGKRLGRPRVAVDARRIAILRAEGHSWAKNRGHLGRW